MDGQQRLRDFTESDIALLKAFEKKYLPGSGEWMLGLKIIGWWRTKGIKEREARLGRWYALNRDTLIKAIKELAVAFRKLGGVLECRKRKGS